MDHIVHLELGLQPACDFICPSSCIMLSQSHEPCLCPPPPGLLGLEPVPPKVLLGGDGDGVVPVVELLVFNEHLEIMHLCKVLWEGIVAGLGLILVCGLVCPHQAKPALVGPHLILCCGPRGPAGLELLGPAGWSNVVQGLFTFFKYFFLILFFTFLIFFDFFFTFFYFFYFFDFLDF